MYVTYVHVLWLRTCTCLQCMYMSVYMYMHVHVHTCVVEPYVMHKCVYVPSLQDFDHGIIVCFMPERSLSDKVRTCVCVCVCTCVCACACMQAGGYACVFVAPTGYSCTNFSFLTVVVRIHVQATSF